MAGYADPPKEHQFKPGKSPNPGGITSEQRRMILENAEKATRIRAALLDKFMDAMAGGLSPDLEANILKLLKDTEDRGLGAPKQTVDGESTVTHVFNTIYEDKPK